MPSQNFRIQIALPWLWQLFGGRFHPLIYNFFECRFCSLHILPFTKRHDRPIGSDPFQQAGTVLKDEILTLLHFGASMKNELDTVLWVQLQRHSIVPSITKTRRIPFDVLGNVLIGAENNSPHVLNCLFQGMVKRL